MNRNIIIVVLIVLIVASLGATGVMVYNMTTKSNSLGNVVGDNQAALYKVAEPDAFAGRDKEAIDVVRNYKVLAPEYIDAVHDAIANGRSNVDVEMKQESIDDLVESQFLEKHIGMTSLKRGQWRALHLDIDEGNDPLYEVYLDYTDENVVVGPVWIVNLETNSVVARNSMARVFDRTISNYDDVESALKRSDGVVHAITSHKFDSGIDLGGVLLLYFLKKTTDP